MRLMLPYEEGAAVAAEAIASLTKMRVPSAEGEAAAQMLMVFHSGVAVRVNGHVRSRWRLAQSRTHSLQHLWWQWAQPHQLLAS